MAKYIYSKTLHSLRWQPETNECVSATDSVKMRVRILTSCKNRVKTLYKQDKERKSQKDKETKSQRVKESKRQRGKETKRQRDEEAKRGREEERKRQTDKKKKGQRKTKKHLEEYGGCAAAVMLPFWSYKSKLLTPNRQHPPCPLSEGCHALQGDKQK